MTDDRKCDSPKRGVKGESVRQLSGSVTGGLSVGGEV